MKNIDFRNGRPLVMMVSQYDYGYSLQVALWSNGTPVTITAAEIVSENFTTMCTFSGNVVTIPVTTSMTERFGHFPAELRVTDSTGQVSSKNFDFFVERSPLAVKSTETYSGDIVEFTAKRVPLSSVVVTMEPIQSLNGYSSPWLGGAGKNKLNVTADTQTIYGITYTVKRDESGNLVSIVANGTASNRSILVLWLDYSDISDFGLDGKYVLTGCPTGGNANTYSLSLQAYGMGNINDVGNGASINTDSLTNQNYRFIIDIKNGTAVNNIVFKPMLRLASVSDATYEPYSNICPISGRTGASVVVSGKNLLASNGNEASGTGGTKTYGGVTFTRLADGGMKVQGTATNTLTVNFGFTETLQPGEYIFSGGSQNPRLAIAISRIWYAGSGPDFIGVTQNNELLFSVTEPVKLYTRIYCYANNTYDMTVYPLLRLASETDDTYEPYKGKVYPITFTSAGTVYAGTVDLVSGRLEVTHELATYDGTSGTFTQNGADIIALAVQTRWQNVGSGYTPISNQFKGLAPGASSGLSAGEFRYTANFVNMNFRFGSAKTVAQWKTELAQQPLQVLHLLATPLTYNLTPTQVMSLLGENVMWSPDGEVTVVVPEYY